MRTLNIIIAAALLAAGVTGCDEDTTAPEPVVNMVDVTAEIWYLTVRQSCDGTNGVGDFYSKVEVYRSPLRGEEELLAETRWVLKQYEAGPNYPPINDIKATGTVPLVNGQRVRFVFRSYENDGGTATDIWAEGSWVYVYDAETGCWNDEINQRPCSATDGTLDYDQNLHMYETQNGPLCDVLIQGRFLITKK